MGQVVFKSSILGQGTNSGQRIEVFDKFHGHSLGLVELASKEQIKIGIDLALNSWQRNVPVDERRRWLQEIQTVLSEQFDAFSELIAREAGKPMRYARAEVSRCIDTLEVARAQALRIPGEVVPLDRGPFVGKRGHAAYFPLGPVGAITPFNFPLNLALHKIAPALVWGVPIFIKPSPLAPLSLLKLARELESRDFPKGILNVVVANPDDAELIVTDPRLKVLSFTGSAEVGWLLKSKANKKRVILELGGNAAIYVDRGEDVEKLARRLAESAFLYSGQVCISTQRIIVHQEVANKLRSILKAEIENLSVGDPMSEQTVVGPLISSEHLKRIDEWVEEAKSLGGKILTGGKIIDSEKNLYAPTLIEGVSRDAKVWKEEVFGPIATIDVVHDYNEAIELINDSRFGLQVGVFSDSMAVVKEFFRRLEVGAVIAQDIPGVRLDSMPYGGVKDSGLGREGLSYAVKEMAELRLLIF